MRPTEETCYATLQIYTVENTRGRYHLVRVLCTGQKQMYRIFVHGSPSLESSSI